MSDDLDVLDPAVPVEALRRRLHKLSDMVYVHEGKLGEYGVLITTVRDAVGDLKKTSASREQLDFAVSSVNTKLDYLTKRIEPVQRALTWTIALVCSAVFLALLQLVLKP